MGLPSDPHYFDAVIGSGWASGREAVLLRDVLYPSAIAVNALRMDATGLGKVLGQQALGSVVTGIHRRVLSRSDLVLAVGPELACDARKLILEARSGADPLIHEPIPGVTVASSAPGFAWSGGKFDLLMLCRAEDRNKGVLDVALAVRDLRSRGPNGRLTTVFRHDRRPYNRPWALRLM
ncbi:hypothetical protein BJF83_01745 [Nocardiopsis sp. CNR-923]|uniref:hypothetical protein n=1 Tax=Nocardiopsis sp. CNR-923 TaxID=1904965 RepID=UPI00095EC156|nr:hypothetical protein [Nocardiopsis sp. CNR-923]OLT28205.1 hypothetical protein BJF83_01745 [Nocardiopsis sp. CNR-923]